MDHGVQSIGGEAAVHRRGEGIDPRGQQIRQEGADDFKGQEEDAQHDGEEQRQGQVFVGHHPIDGLAAGAPGTPGTSPPSPEQMVSMKV